MLSVTLGLLSGAPSESRAFEDEPPPSTCNQDSLGALLFGLGSSRVHCRKSLLSD